MVGRNLGSTGFTRFRLISTLNRHQDRHQFLLPRTPRRLDPHFAHESPRHCPTLWPTTLPRPRSLPHRCRPCATGTGSTLAAPRSRYFAGNGPSGAFRQAEQRSFVPLGATSGGLVGRTISPWRASVGYQVLPHRQREHGWCPSTMNHVAIAVRPWRPTLGGRTAAVPGIGGFAVLRASASRLWRPIQLR